MSTINHSLSLNQASILLIEGTSLSASPSSRDETGRLATLELPSITATLTASMAAFRRAAALAGKLNLWSSTKSELLGAPNMHGRRTRRCLAAGLCAAAGGALALYFYNEIWSGRKRMRRRSINGLPLPSIPTVEAKEKVSGHKKKATRKPCSLCNT
ncbi:hypothetical protein GOODEAATRI_030044 [Goodea atripinnis]|uniref:Uncharacterized protein n=1 Tax=Goodea atripinnis TaxID=208336 RepID=A0ABV0Q2Z5_9TELE